MGFIENSIKAYLEVKEQEDKKKVAKEEKPKRSVEELEKEIEGLKAELAKAKEESDLAPEPNSDTGEIPLRVGIAQSILDKKAKKEENEEIEQEKI